MDWSEFWAALGGWLANTGIKIVIALVIWIVSFKIINKLAKKFSERVEGKVAANKNIDKTLYKTLSYLVKVVLKVLVIICLVGYLGIDTSGLTALITSLGVCVGLAVNGTLSNLAGGVLILITRPFKDDDYIEACGYEGIVEEIRICNTKLVTFDNKVIYLPNGTLSGSTIVNYSEKDIRGVNLSFALKHSTDFERAQKIILDIAAEDKLVLKEGKLPVVRINAVTSRGVELFTRVWCKTDDYWTVFFNMNEAVKKAFDENGIEVPADRLDVTVKQD